MAKTKDTKQHFEMPDKVRVALEIKLTISREDGSPIFSHDETAQVVYLTEEQQVVVIERDGGAISMVRGDNINSVVEMIQDRKEVLSET